MHHPSSAALNFEVPILAERAPLQDSGRVHDGQPAVQLPA